MFSDESAAKTNMARLRARALRGRRAHAKAPHGHWQTTTMISSIRLDGQTASMVINGPSNTDVFRAYVRHVLVPSLRAGDVVVMDHLGTHKSEETLKLIAQAGAKVCFLPAYSPDYNPIEKMWSKVKSLLRSFEARTLDELIDAIGRSLAKITPKDALGWFVSCGYNFL